MYKKNMGPMGPRGLGPWAQGPRGLGPIQKKNSNYVVRTS